MYFGIALKREENGEQFIPLPYFFRSGTKYFGGPMHDRGTCFPLSFVRRVFPAECWTRNLGTDWNGLPIILRTRNAIFRDVTMSLRKVRIYQTEGSENFFDFKKTSVF